MDEEISLEEFAKRNNLTLPSLTEETEDTELDDYLAKNNLAPIPGTGQISRDVTEEVKASETADSLSYDDLYSKRFGERPTVGLMTGTKELFSRGVNAVVGEENATVTPSMAEADRIRAEQSVYDDKANRLYDSLGSVEEPTASNALTSGRVYERYTVDDEGNAVLENRVKVPRPDSTAVGRVVGSAGRDIYAEFGGLLTEGSLAGDSQLAKSVPDSELDPSEDLASDILSFGLPAAGAVGATVKGIKAGRRVLQGIDVSTDLGKMATLAASTISASVSDLVMSSEGDSGMIFDPEMVKATLPWIKDEDTARQVGVAADGMLLNGVMDGLLMVVGRVGDAASRRYDGIRNFLDKDRLRTVVQDGTVLNVVTYLDPSLKETTPETFLRNTKELSRILEANSVKTVVLGGFSKDIKVDTARALAGGAEAYIRTTRQALKDTMAPEAFETMVEEESADMVSRMLTLLRVESGNPRIRDVGSRVTNEMGEAFLEASDSLLPNGMTMSEATSNTASDLATLQGRTVATEQGKLVAADANLAGIDHQAARVVQDNPVVQDLLNQIQPGLTFDEREYSALADKLVTSGLYPEIVGTLDEVDAAYAAIPRGGPVDAEALYDSFKQVTAAASVSDVPGNPGGKVRYILSSLGGKFAPLKDEIDADGKPILDMIFARVGSQVDTKDLVDLKGNLARVINETSDPAVRGRLIDFRRHITGDQMDFAAQNGSPDVAAAVQTADALYKATMSRFENNPVLNEIFQSAKTVRQFEDTNYPGPYLRGEPGMIQTADRILRQVSDDQTGTMLQGLEYALSASKGTDARSFVRDPFSAMYVAQATKSLSDAIMRGDTQGEAMIRSAFEGVRQKLQNVGAGDLLDRIETTAQEIGRQTDDLATQRTGAVATREAIEGSIREAQTGILSELMSKAPGVGPYAPVADPKRVFQSILTRNDAASYIKSLQDQIAQLPSDMQKNAANSTLEAVTLEMIGSKLFGATPVGMKTASDPYRNIALGKVATLSADESGNLAGAIRQVFGQNSAVAEGVSQSLDMIYKASIPERIRVGQADSATLPLAKVNKEISDAVSTGILLVAGYMNPTAALARRLAAAPVKEAERISKEVAQTTLVTIITEPQMFARMVDLLSQGDRSTASKIASTITKGTVQPAVVARRGATADFRIQSEDPNYAPIELEMEALGLNEDGTPMAEEPMPPWLRYK